MIHISTAQIDAMKALQLHAFKKKLGTFMRSIRPSLRAYESDEFPNDCELDERICAAIHNAQGFGLDSELALAQFVLLSIAYSHDFYDIPGANALLRSAERDTNESMQMVLNAVIVAEARGQ